MRPRLGLSRPPSSRVLQAFKTWEHTPLATRRSVFLKAAELFTSPKYQALITSTVNAETAASKEMMLNNVHASAVWASETAAMTAKLKGETFPSWVPGGHCIVQRRAYVALASRAACRTLTCFPQTRSCVFYQSLERARQSRDAIHRSGDHLRCARSGILRWYLTRYRKHRGA